LGGAGRGASLVRRDTTARCVRIKKWVWAMPKGPMHAPDAPGAVRAHALVR